jgi:hypothetical protein
MCERKSGPDRAKNSPIARELHRGTRTYPVWIQALYAEFDLEAGSDRFGSSFVFLEVLQDLVHRLFLPFAALVIFEQQGA